MPGNRLFGRSGLQRGAKSDERERSKDESFLSSKSFPTQTEKLFFCCRKSALARRVRPSAFGRLLVSRFCIRTTEDIDALPRRFTGDGGPQDHQLNHDLTEFRPIRWQDDDSVALIDQTRLPLEEVWLRFEDYRGVVGAIEEMRVRGAPAIGIAGAYAVALAALELDRQGVEDLAEALPALAREIRAARPTAVNLAWAVDRMLERARVSGGASALVHEAKRIHEEDVAANHDIGRHGAGLLETGSSVLTHCNTGALATGGYGTALGVIRAAWSQGKIATVYATETRPLLQGARLTAWELARAGIPFTLIPDSAAAYLMGLGSVDAVIVGADRIAANGDVANKIGTYGLAVLAKEHGLPFYVAAPTSTIDLDVDTGADIPLEHRPVDEVTSVAGVPITIEGVQVLNAAFDVTPAEYVSAIITERGALRGPYRLALESLLEPARA